MQGIPVFISQRIRDAPICFFFVYPTWLRCMFVGCWTPPPLSRPERSAQHIFQRYLLRAWGNSWIRWTWQQCCNQHCPWIKWMKILIGFVILTMLATPSFSSTKQMPVEQCQEIYDGIQFPADDGGRTLGRFARQRRWQTGSGWIDLGHQPCR